MIALIDCNNFFVSCERVFQPRLQGVPTIVMSSNDGCVIARSQEVKSIGIPMGIPIFKIQEWIKTYDIQLRSTNFPLYRDMSRRVMDVIRSMTDVCQVYSVDEAFFEIPEGEDAYALSKRIQEAIFLHTGIPTSVGVAQTKTLAKVANRQAKKSDSHICVIKTDAEREEMLRQTSAGEVWGIGRGFSERLMDNGIRTAYELSVADDGRIRSIFGIHGLHTAHELRGMRCFEVETDSDPKKSMISSRSFGQAVSDKKSLWNSIAYHVNELASELREEGQFVQRIRIALYVHRFREDRRNSGSDERFLERPTSDTTTLLRVARELFEHAYVPGRSYSKSGVTFSSLSPDDRPMQDTLFEHAAFPGGVSITDRLMDDLNVKYGKDRVVLAEMLNPIRDRSWRPRSSQRSGSYTTSWDELLEIG